ncbi:MAG: magnesium/cobalt transporter CorA [Candidatus Bathyarchaeota archaeon]|nr:magnesium/cobalt transporter CorA [Candidatus Bathyarchaeota archaeon]
MAGILVRKSKKTGLPPGTPVYVGDEEPLPAHIDEISYDKDEFREKVVDDVTEILDDLKSPDTTWVNVNGLKVSDIIEIGTAMGFHPLIQEDIVNTLQRPKVEEYPDHIFFVLKMIKYDEESEEIDVEQVSFILGDRYLVSFQERHGDCFNIIRQRIRENKGIIRKMGADYLAYSLIDMIVDGYFTVLEQIGDRIEEIEDELVINPQIDTLHDIYAMKRQMIGIRKSVWPLREVISRLDRIGSKQFKEGTSIYIRDVYDHTIQVIDAIETYRDLLSGMLDIYLSSISNKMNQIMQLLTIIGTIFIPLTFLAGIYGMNFQYMPELGWRNAYPALWGIMIIITGLMVVYFRRRKWL